jgi:hypothetical protein
VANHLIDTDLYIDLIQSGATLPVGRELYDKDTPGIYFMPALRLPNDGRKRFSDLLRELVGL